MGHQGILRFGLVLCFVAASTCALGDDLLPPEWRGAPNSTMQAWEFSTDANPATPDVISNAYGTPVATVYGEFNFPNRDTFWVNETTFDHQGVWCVGGAMSLEIPNDPVLRPQKKIRVQITYDGGTTTPEPAPWLNVFATDGAQVVESELVQQIILDNYYVHDTYDIVLQPNPSEETIWISPYYCHVYIDEVVVDTICCDVPEPSTVLLLIAGAGGLLAVSRRKKMQ